jgi:hypothetical protein
MGVRLLPGPVALLLCTASTAGAQEPIVYIAEGCVDSTDAAWFQPCSVIKQWKVKAVPSAVTPSVLDALRLANFQRVELDSADGSYTIVADSLGESPFGIKPECENMAARNSTRAQWRVQRKGSKASVVELAVANHKVPFAAANSCPHANMLPLIMTLLLAAEVDSTMAKR